MSKIAEYWGRCLAVAWLGIGLSGCSTISISDHDDICKVLARKPSWSIALDAAERRWQADPALVMAFIHQESRFDPHAYPDASQSRKQAQKGEGAYGYAQAKLSTWDRYRESTDNTIASRSNFFDSVSFIGWYNWQSHIELNIGLKKAKELYYAYHEGRTGYETGSYLEPEREWLREVAAKVEDRYRLYRRQYRSGCLSDTRARRRVAPGR